MKKILSIILILIMIFSTGCSSNKNKNSDDIFWTSAKVKFYNKKGICPICHEPLVKYCYGTNGGPYFLWSCPKGCEDE